MAAALLVVPVALVAAPQVSQATPEPAGGTPGPQGAHLTYNGGPVISNVAVHSVYWGSGTYEQGAGPNDPKIVNFFKGVTNSAYMDWLLEYDTPSQHIGRGSYTGQTTITPSVLNDTVTIDSSNIENELVAQLTAGSLPAPQTDAGGNVNSLYAVFIPQGKTLTESGGVGGVAFCAYHGAVMFNSKIVPYAVLPDFDDPGYGDGCGSDADLFNNFTSTVAHELIESVTDPGVSLANGDGPPLGWYDNGKGVGGESSGGEIADLCDSQGPLTGGDGATYIVQAEFNNATKLCTIVPPDGYAAACANASTNGFADAGLAADCLKFYGVSLGKADGTFGEDDPLIRSQVSSLLARMLQLAGVTLSQTHAFPDVNADTVPNAQVRTEIEQLAGSGIIAGFPDGTFGPATNLTVAQAATLVIRTLQVIRSTHPNAPNLTDQGSTSANYVSAIVQGILDTVAADKSGAAYPRQASDTTKRGSLADMLAQSIQLLVTAGVIAQP